MKRTGTSTAWNISPMLEIHSKLNELMSGQPSLLIIKRIQGITSGKAPNSYIAKEHESHLSSAVFYENVDFTHHRYLAISWGSYMLQFWSLQGSLYGHFDSNNTDIDFYILNKTTSHLLQSGMCFFLLKALQCLFI